MTDLNEAIAALGRRVEALEAENERLRTGEARARSRPPQDLAPSRRGLLAGGAGLFGALMVGAVVSPGQGGAAPAHVVDPGPHAASTLIGTRVTVTPQRGGGHHWARYEWDMDRRFAGAQSPAVLASACDDYHGVGERAEPTVAVALKRVGALWYADILVNHVGHLATEVTLTIIAFGTEL